MRLYSLRRKVFDIPAGVIFYPLKDEVDGVVRYKTDFPSKFILSWWIEPDAIASSPDFEVLGQPEEYHEVRVNLTNRIKGII